MTFNKYKYAALGACAASALFATDALAQSQQIVGATVTTTVQNSFTLTETTPMNLGTIAIFCDNANTSSATLSTAGALTPAAPAGAAQVIDISNVGRTQAVFDVTGAAPTAALTITLANPGNLTCTGGSCAGSPDITLGGLTDDAGGTVTTSNAGAATVNVGATITTNAACASQYLDGVFQGTYDITLSY